MKTAHPAVRPDRRSVGFGMDWAGASDRGLVRTTNQDAFLIVPESGLLIVADGMGGQAAGDVAAALAVAAVSEAILSGGDRPAATLLDQGFVCAEAAVCRHVLAHPARRGMATAVAAAVIRGNRVALAHLGDVRIYLARDDLLQRLTDDHTPPGRLLLAGLLNEEEARQHPDRNVVLEAVTDSKRPVRPQLASFDLQDGDCLLLCSDGLWGDVPHSELAAAITVSCSATDIVQRLIDRAIAAGGTDNITAALFRCRAPAD